MRLEDLEVFRHAHEAGNFHKAAQRAGLTQSAVTKVIRRLENEFGVVLFERGGRGLPLTSASKTLYERAIDMHALATGMCHDMEAERTALGGSVRIGIVPALVDSVVNPVVRDILAERPEVRVLVSVKLSGELIQMVQDGRLDIALCYGPDEPEDLSRTEVGIQSHSLVVGPDHPLAETRPNLEQLAREQWLLATRDVRLRRGIEKMFADAGFSQLQIRVETDASSFYFASLLRHTRLVAVLASQSLALPQCIDLKVLNTELSVIATRVAIYHRRRAPSTSLFIRFKHLLTSHVEAALGKS